MDLLSQIDEKNPYRSNEIMVIVQMETHPNKEPLNAYNSHANGPNVHVSCKQLKNIAGHNVNIIIKSENAKLTINIFEGVRNALVDKKMYNTTKLPQHEMTAITTK